jgi:hypothetical protein
VKKLPSRLLATLYISYSMAINAPAHAGSSDVPTFENISPRNALGPPVQNGSIGGRVNKLSGLSKGSQLVVAASEWSGLFASEDSGFNWHPMGAYLPRVASSVAVNPMDDNRIIASSLFDGRMAPLSGFATTSNRGKTWDYINWNELTAKVTCDPHVKEAPAGAGISIDPKNPRVIAVATNCGIAISDDAGMHWRLETADREKPAAMVWDVSVRSGTVYGCGDDGFFKIDYSIGKWIYPSPDSKDVPPQGLCSLAVSPTEADVIYETVGERVYESVDAGFSWADQGAPEQGSGRIPFVATVGTGPHSFQLWYGDAGLFRRDCLDAADDAARPITRCFQGSPVPPWESGLGSPLGAHDDAGDLVFDNTSDGIGCPRVFSSDGGIYLNQIQSSPSCRTPKWQAPETSPPALWAMALGGARAGGSATSLLYLGAQDNGLTTGKEDFSGHLAWTNLTCCDAFNVVNIDSGHKILYSVCCYKNDAGEWTGTLYASDLNGANETEVPSPSGLMPGWTGRPAIASVGNHGAIALTNTGVHFTTDITEEHVNWVPVGAPTRLDGCTIQTALSQRRITIYVLAGTCRGSSQDVLWRYTAIPGDLSRKWQAVPPGKGTAGIGIFGADPKNPNHIIISRIDDTHVEMLRTADGGRTWIPIPALDRLMTGNGKLRYLVPTGRNDWATFEGYAQPRFVAYNPRNGRIVLAGGIDSGLFISMDSGETWRNLTRPIGPRTNPEIMRPMNVYFAGASPSSDIYVSTQGSGIWRIRGIKIPSKYAHCKQGKLTPSLAPQCA